MLGAPLKADGAAATATTVPALASLGLASWLCAEPRPAVVMGRSARFAWCRLEDEVVLLAASEAVRFPNAVLAGDGWEAIEPGDRIQIGSGAVLGGGCDWRVVRWWDPSVAPIDAERSDVMAQVSAVAERVGPGAVALEAALASGERDHVLHAALGLLGAGGGLTPAGDDALVGAFAAYRHVTASLGRSAGGALIHDVADELLPIAAVRTTLLSATLLRHACAGEVPEPVADLMRAVTGRGRTFDALDRCLALGASSGRALAQGVVVGARAGRGASP